MKPKQGTRWSSILDRSGLISSSSLNQKSEQWELLIKEIEDLAKIAESVGRKLDRLLQKKLEIANGTSDISSDSPE